MIRLKDSTDKLDILVKRLSITTIGRQLSVPSKISKILMKNSGTNVIRFNFNNNNENDFFTIESKETLETVLYIPPGTSINLKSIGGDSTLEIIGWSR